MSKLLPIRWAEADFFVADIFDASPKDDVHSMEHPLFTLSKKPDTTIRRYEHNGNTIEIQPGIVGMPTIWDKDILIFIASQASEALNRGRPDAKNAVVHFRAYDYFVATNRRHDGKDYAALREGLDRLAAQRIKTNISTGKGKTRVVTNFGLITGWQIIEKSSTDSTMIAIEVGLSDWLHNAIQAREVLTLHRDYFRLSGAIDRRLYELARKHCGKQPKWSISLENLHKKSGSSASLRRFRQSIKAIAAEDVLPTYRMSFDVEADLVTFTNSDQGAFIGQLGLGLGAGNKNEEEL